jgi:hypothetical protein
MRRWLLAGVMLAFPVAGAVTFATQAQAASVSTTGVSCTGLSGKVDLKNDSATIKLTGCNDTANTGGKGTTKGSETSTKASITWNKTGTTTEGSVKNTEVTPDTCPTPTGGTQDIEELSTATVTGGTSKAKASIKKGWTIQSHVCYDSGNSELSLLPGTDYQIGPGL